LRPARREDCALILRFIHELAAYEKLPHEVVATEEMLADWDSLPDGAELMLDHAMTGLTLAIIAKTMFSSDAEDMGELVAASAERYQIEVRPTLFDLLSLPRWVPRLRSMKYAERIFTDFDREIERMIALRRAERV
jgi:cytochrome P450